MVSDTGDGGAEDQDAEPTLNAPGEAGPTGIDAAGEPASDEAGDTSGEDDQDAEPSQNAPGDAGPA